MPKNKVSEWSSTPSNNTDIGGINIAEGCAPSGINNAIREMMAQVKDMQSGTDADNFVVGGNLSVTGSVSLTTALPVASGGTGVSTVTTGDILYSSAVDTLARLAGTGTTGSVLLSGTAPSWGKVPMSTHVSGQLPVANGGTGASTLTSKAVLIGEGTNAISSVSPGTDDNVLVSDGTNWTSASISTIASFANSIGSSGYQKFPGGLMIQWGTFTSNTDTYQTVSFPTTFPNACYSVIVSLASFNAITFTTSSFSFDRNSDISGSVAAYWIAIGS